MVATAILSADPTVRRSLELRVRDDPDIAVIGLLDDPAKLSGLSDNDRFDVVLVHSPLVSVFVDWYSAHEDVRWIALFEGSNAENGFTALGLGASAVLPLGCERAQLVSAIKAVATGLVVFRPQDLAPLVDADGRARPRSALNGHAVLTQRELQVLTAMADGASNKVIARRLGISFHTVKFHVAAILDKFDAESRTEAVMKAAQQGVVML
jgi:DNA-binding NarL/FixJ family response regulator